MDLVPKYAKDLKPEALVALERKPDSLRFQLVVRSLSVASSASYRICTACSARHTEERPDSQPVSSPRP